MKLRLLDLVHARATWETTVAYVVVVITMMLLTSRRVTFTEATTGLGVGAVLWVAVRIVRELRVVHDELLTTNAMLNRIDQLTAALVDAGLAVPDNPAATATIAARRRRGGGEHHA